MEGSAVDFLPGQLETLLEDGEFVLCRSGRRHRHDLAVAFGARGDAAVGASATAGRADARARTLAAGRIGSGVGDSPRCADDARGAGWHSSSRIRVATCSYNALGTPMDVGDVLRVGAGLAAALRQLHGRGLIHKDIKPANVMIDGRTGRVWLRGFGIASRLPRERRLPEPPEVIAGTLAYMAPEQTGWMNRSIDARSDLYALGVVLYELSTGSLPFTASDPMEWVHCHIAKRPVPPAERRQGMPEVVSAIVMKLLAKTAEDRYQTAAGVEQRPAALPRAVGSRRPDRRIPARRTRHTRPAGHSGKAVWTRARDRDAARRLRARGDERDAGAGARLRVLRHRQVIGGERAAQGARAAARTVRLGQVRSIQARHPLRDAGPGVSEPRSTSARQERRRAEWLARRARRRRWARMGSS